MARHTSDGAIRVLRIGPWFAVPAVSSRLRPLGLLEAAFLRSPTAHGLVRSIDASTAQALPGVHAVYTLADLRPVLLPTVCHCNFQRRAATRHFAFILAGKEVSYVGEAIALVVADNRYIAEDALALIETEFKSAGRLGCRDALSVTRPTCTPTARAIS